MLAGESQESYQRRTLTGIINSDPESPSQYGQSFAFTDQNLIFKTQSGFPEQNLSHQLQASTGLNVHVSSLAS